MKKLFFIFLAGFALAACEVNEITAVDLSTLPDGRFRGVPQDNQISCIFLEVSEGNPESWLVDVGCDGRWPRQRDGAQSSINVTSSEQENRPGFWYVPDQLRIIRNRSNGTSFTVDFTIQDQNIFQGLFIHRRSDGSVDIRETLDFARR